MIPPEVQAPAPLSGLLLVDKPKNWTSHDVVAVVRRYFPRKIKVGHTGTLDPLATGLLILLVGAATKKAAGYQGLDKTYSGVIRFGIETRTADLEGEVEREAPVPALTAARLQALFDRFHGEVEMPVPRYSALKHKGKPLYKYARAGEVVPEKTRKSKIHAWKLAAWESPDASFTVACSSGTYVRALAVLAGSEVGCGAALAGLRRESVGTFRVEDALTIDRIRAIGAASKGSLAGNLLKADAARV